MELYIAIMHIHIVTIGSPKLSFAREGFDEYLKRLGGFHSVQVTHIKDDQKATQKMLAFTKDTFAIALDENGTQYTSKDFAKKLEFLSQDGHNDITFLIGGPDGHCAELLESSQHKWALGKLTLPHDLAMLFCAEALYRASTINAGHPYHRQ